ncbi:MAG: heavy metal translocating P-type ATPase [Candidatus Falkowbacteria bacterium]
MAKATYPVVGMHCASCARIVEKEIKALPGVKSASVNYATEKAVIDYDAGLSNPKTFNETIAKLGYALDLGEKETSKKELAEIDEERKAAELAAPLALVIFLIMLWDSAAQLWPSFPNFPLPMSYMIALQFIIATLVIFTAGRRYLLAVVRFIQYHKANMDTLVGIGTATAYIYSSLIYLFPAIAALLSARHLYFDATIVVIGFITLGKYLEKNSKKKTSRAIEKLAGLAAKTALVERNGTTVEIPTNEVMIGDIVVIKPAGKIPVDGIIIEGSSSIDEAMLSGEPLPADKVVGDKVFGGTINRQSLIKVRAEAVGESSLLAQIVKLTEEAANSKAPIEALADQISAVFVPIVLIIAVLAMAVWMVIGYQTIGWNLAISYGLNALVAVLVIACPCALGLATPTAMIVGVGQGAKNGILIKTAAALERLAKINTVVFDKTGTLTVGQPKVVEVITLDNSLSTAEAIALAAAVESGSEHPLAKAIIDYAEEKKIKIAKASDFVAQAGFGISANINGQKATVRKADDNDGNQVDAWRLKGRTVATLEINGQAAALIGISDTIKPEAKAVIAELKKKGIKTIMLTGDHRHAADTIAQLCGIDQVIAEVMPADKAAKVHELTASGKVVAMVGDGLNDAPALAAADVSLAMATGTDIAMEAADITLLKGDLTKILSAERLAVLTMRTVKQNLFWAFVYNIIGIPLAAGLFYPFFGWLLNPVFAGAAMSLSSVSVVANSLRLSAKKIK